MAERLAYARRASGLVRGLSLWDAFAVGFMNQGLVASVALTITLGLGVFLGGNLVIAAIVSVIPAAIGFTLVWGVLGGSMPRSGGPYVYNSRIIHPLVGIAQSFGDALIWLWWIGTLAPYAVDPGLVEMFNFLGWERASDWLGHDYALFLVASLFNVAGFLFAVFGLSVFRRAQNVFMALGLAGGLAIAVVFSLTPHAEFVERWNALARRSSSLSYNEFLQKADTVVRAGGIVGGIPTTWNWVDTLGVMFTMSWLFAYGYSISFIGGEVRRPERNLVIANLLAVVVPFAFILWIALALYHSVGFQFLSAAAWHDNFVDGGGSLPGYAAPWPTGILGLIAVAADNRAVAAFVALAFVGFNVWWVALSYLAFPRTLFAWGMDRMGPKWFTDINPRFASPVKNHIVCLVFGELLVMAYAFLYSDRMQNLTLTGLEITSVFAITAVAAILFPFSKRARGVWKQSPFGRRGALGAVLIVSGGVVNLVYLGILMYALVVMRASTAFQWFTFAMFVFAWLLGIVWYYIWRSRSRQVGVDVSRAYGELPPE